MTIKLGFSAKNQENGLHKTTSRGIENLRVSWPKRTEPWKLYHVIKHWRET